MPPPGVSIHAPVRGATGKAHALHLLQIGFNPRAREGRDQVNISKLAKRTVSIHAPVRGATKRIEQSCLTGKSFNPRAREGRDAHLAVALDHKLAVSIHAPVRGATVANNISLIY